MALFGMGGGRIFQFFPRLVVFAATGHKIKYRYYEFHVFPSGVPAWNAPVEQPDDCIPTNILLFARSLQFHRVGRGYSPIFYGLGPRWMDRIQLFRR